MPNAKVLESKKAVVEALTGKIQEATSVVFVDYKGITVAQDNELRKQFREAGVEYSVATACIASSNEWHEIMFGTMPANDFSSFSLSTPIHTSVCTFFCARSKSGA